jgi:hypothetical protein
MNRRKWILVACFWVVQALTAYIGCAFLWCSVQNVNGPQGNLIPAVSWESFTSILTNSEYLLWCGAFAVGVPILQLLFLIPVRKPRVASGGGWFGGGWFGGHAPAWLSAAVGGLCIAGLIVAACFAASEVWDQYVFAINIRASTPVLVAFGSISWLVGTALILAFCRGPRREDVLARLAARIFLGTIVEIAAIIPLDALVRKRETCHCWAGTYFALLICGAVGAVVFGPAVFLPVLVRRRKRFYQGRCQVCGYDMSATPNADACPECGSGWRG